MATGMDDKIAILSPIGNVCQLAQEVVGELPYRVPVLPARAENAVELAQELLSKGTEVLIARGNILKRLRENLDVETVGLEVTEGDLYPIFYRYRNYRQPVAIIEGEAVLQACQRVNQVFKLDLRYYRVEETRDFRLQTHKAVREGIQVLVGGSFGLEIGPYLELRGIGYEYITSTHASIASALRLAEALCRAKGRSKGETAFLKTVLDHAGNGIVTVDRAGRIIHVNSTAERMLGVAEGAAQGRRSGQVFPQLGLEEALEGTEERPPLREAEAKGGAVLVRRAVMRDGDEITGALAAISPVDEVRQLERYIRSNSVKKGLYAKYTFDDLIGESRALRQTVELAQKYSRIDATVLLEGETGTGKEIFAQAIHNASLRRNAPFVAINCSALPSNLLESELFGYEEGAFTGAKRGGKTGLFELAHGGTLFLDEIGELEGGMQSKLLRALQEREIRRVGDSRVIPVDVRVIAATNRDLYQEMQTGQFRQDLYYRLNVLNILVPPLRDRPEDIPALVGHYVEQFNREHGFQVEGVAPQAMERLARQPWPGNVRELRNAVEKLVILTQRGQATAATLELAVREPRGAGGRGRPESLEDLERQAILGALERCGGNQSWAARELGIDRTTLGRKLRRYHII